MILYKKDTKWNIRFLSITAIWDVLMQISWIEWTSSPITASKICKPKNIWKSNETTWEAQAIQEADSLIKDKLTKGYFYSIEELSSSDDVILPMLAKDFTKEQKKVDWDNCYIQPKLDWMRALIKIKDWLPTIWSRQWKEITTVPHIISSLTYWTEEFDVCDITLDWELYAHWFTFQENMEMVKKFRPWITDKFIKFHMYDRVASIPFKNRFLLDEQIQWFDSNISIVHTYWIRSIEELKGRHALNIEDGYEGSIVRWGNEWYKANWRSSNLLKYKDFLDITATIIDVEPSDARPLQWVLVCALPTWEKFKSNLKFSHKEREEILSNKDKYIWQTAEIRFFEYTDGWLPRFPVCVGFRLDK